MTVQLALSKATRIGWIGTGVMGSSMCGHVLTAGYRVTLHSRTKTKAQPLVDLGAAWAENPLTVAAQSDMIFTMVGFPQDVRAVYFGETGILAGAQSGTVLIDMTTTNPTLSREIAECATTKGLSAIDAPVSGGDVGARNATLSIMVGGDRRAVQAVVPLFELLGNTIVHQGGPGTGQQAKLCNQIVIAGDAGAIDRAIELLKAKGAKRAIKLNVSAPFHCALMQPAQDRLAEDLEELSFKDLSVPLVTNVDAAAIKTGAEARAALVRQVSQPVRWLESVEFLAKHGVQSLIEIGPGKVLSGLARQINRDLRLSNVEDEASLRGAREALAG